MRRLGFVGLCLCGHLGIVAMLVDLASHLVGNQLPLGEAFLVAVWTLPCTLFMSWFLAEEFLRKLQPTQLSRPLKFTVAHSSTIPSVEPFTSTAWGCHSLTSRSVTYTHSVSQ